jgi:bacterioferritin
MNNDFIVALNEDLALEYAAALQYIQHAAMVDGLYTPFAAELLAHADDEIGHAKTLSSYINYIGGIPVAKSTDTFTASDNVRMLQQDLAAENDAVMRYKQRIAQARAMGEYGAEAILLEILADEEHHANDLETFLSVQK